MVKTILWAIDTGTCLSLSFLYIQLLLSSSTLNRFFLRWPLGQGVVTGVFSFPLRYVPCGLSRIVFSIPTFQLQMLVDFHRTLRWCMSRHVSTDVSARSPIDLLICPSVDLSIYPSLDLSVYIHLSIYRSIDLPIYRSTHLPTYRSTDLSIYRSTDLPIYRSTDLLISRSTDLPIYRSTDLPIYRSTDLPIYPSADLSIYRCIDLPMYRSTDVSIDRSIDRPMYRSTDVSICRCIDLLMYRSTAVSIYRSTDVSIYRSASWARQEALIGTISQYNTQFLEFGSEILTRDLKQDEQHIQTRMQKKNVLLRPAQNFCWSLRRGKVNRFFFFRISLSVLF